MHTAAVQDTQKRRKKQNETEGQESFIARANFKLIRKVQSVTSGNVLLSHKGVRRRRTQRTGKDTRRQESLTLCS